MRTLILIESKDFRPRHGLGLVLGLFLGVSAPFLQAQEDAVSRADHEALRQEVEKLRAEIDALQSESGEADVLDEDPPRQDDAGRFAPPDTATEVVTAWDPVLTFTSPDDRFSFGVRGRIQPRYEYERREGQSNHSSFSIRRARLDFRGHAYTRDLTYRIMPEWNRTGTLRDAWANYQFGDFAQLRFGQYNVPFAWARDSSSNRHQFVERSAANNEFQWNDGRDIGLMLHGELTGQVRYGVGIFGGEGREVRRTGSEGNLYTARVTYTPVGEYPGSEALIQEIDGTNLAFGLGAGYNNKNTPRNGSTTVPWDDAHVFGTTVDAHLQAGRSSTHLTGFLRDVDPRDDTPSYDGRGFTLQTGYLLLPDRLFGNLRYSHSEPNTDQSQGKQREMMAGLQVYHSGHGSKIHLEAGRIQNHDGDDWLDTDIIRTQYQLLF